MTNIFYGMEWLLAPGADMEGGCRKFYKDYPHSRTYFTEEGWGLFEGSDGPAIWKAWCEDKGVTPRSVCVLRPDLPGKVVFEDSVQLVCEVMDNSREVPYAVPAR